MVRRLQIYRDPEAPLTRGDCEDGPRPCPWIACRYHVAIRDITPDGKIKWTPNWINKPTCTLDIADEGEQSLADIARLYGVSREWIRQLEEIALRKLRRLPKG
jgi:hypothetical protein